MCFTHIDSCGEKGPRRRDRSRLARNRSFEAFFGREEHDLMAAMFAPSSSEESVAENLTVSPCVVIEKSAAMIRIPQEFIDNDQTLSNMDQHVIHELQRYHKGPHMDSRLDLDYEVKYVPSKETVDEWIKVPVGDRVIVASASMDSQIRLQKRRNVHHENLELELAASKEENIVLTERKNADLDAVNAGISQLCFELTF
jgi:hypothetical protein